MACPVMTMNHDSLTHLARRRATLYAALGFCQLQPTPETPEIAAFQRWMMTWRGIGDVVTGMERQGYALAFRRLVDDGWTAAFQEHRLLAPAGRANAPTPFRGGHRRGVEGAEP
jgi:hypothetical protein